MKRFFATLGAFTFVQAPPEVCRADVAPEPGLAFVDARPGSLGGIARIEWHGRVLFPPPDEPKGLDRHVAGHSGSLALVGRFARADLHRWIFQSIGIDDCSSYGVWVLDVRGGQAAVRRVFRKCINGTVEILWWKPRAQVLVVSLSLAPRVMRWAVDLDESS